MPGQKTLPLNAEPDKHLKKHLSVTAQMSMDTHLAHISQGRMRVLRTNANEHACSGASGPDEEEHCGRLPRPPERVTIADNAAVIDKVTVEMDTTVEKVATEEVIDITHASLLSALDIPVEQVEVISRVHRSGVSGAGGDAPHGKCEQPGHRNRWADIDPDIDSDSGSEASTDAGTHVYSSGCSSQAASRGSSLSETSDPEPKGPCIETTLRCAPGMEEVLSYSEGFWIEEERPLQEGRTAAEIHPADSSTDMAGREMTAKVKVNNKEKNE